MHTQVWWLHQWLPRNRSWRYYRHNLRQHLRLASHGLQITFRLHSKSHHQLSVSIVCFLSGFLSYPSFNNVGNLYILVLSFDLKRDMWKRMVERLKWMPLWKIVWREKSSQIQQLCLWQWSSLWWFCPHLMTDYCSVHPDLSIHSTTFFVANNIPIFSMPNK